MPTKPPSIGMSTFRSLGETMRAQLTRATSSSSGMSKSRIRRGGMAPPQGLMRPARSSSSTERPLRGEIGRRRGAGRAAADHHDVEGLGLRHVPHLPPRPAA